MAQAGSGTGVFARGDLVRMEPADIPADVMADIHRQPGTGPGDLSVGLATCPSGRPVFRSACGQHVVTPAVAGSASVGPVVSRAWLNRHADAVVLADVRRDVAGWSAEAAYAAGHLPGAVLIDLERWLSAPATSTAGRHPLPTPEVFAEGMSSADVGDDDAVVAYDDVGGVIAARLVWMLRTTGHAAALLDDGGRPDDDVQQDPPTTTRKAHFTPRPWPSS